MELDHASLEEEDAGEDSGHLAMLLIGAWCLYSGKVSGETF